jgi:hypothetical protein
VSSSSSKSRGVVDGKRLFASSTPITSTTRSSNQDEDSEALCLTRRNEQREDEDESVELSALDGTNKDNDEISDVMDEDEDEDDTGIEVDVVSPGSPSDDITRSDTTSPSVMTSQNPMTSHASIFRPFSESSVVNVGSTH